MAISAKRIKEVLAMPDGLKTVAQAFGRTLRDFGYNSLTDEYVKGEIARLQKPGELPKGGPSTFIKGWLDKGID